MQFSATPDGCYYDLTKWNNKNYKVILGDVDKKYTSAMDIYNDDRVFQNTKLICYKDNEVNKTIIDKSTTIENINEIYKVLEKFEAPSYVIIRVSTRKTEYQDTLRMLKMVFHEYKYNHIEYNQSLNIDINSFLLDNKPEKTTFIYIKEKLRVAFTINQKYISIMYDRYVETPNDSAIIQSLIGRATGFNHNTKIFIFTNIESILKYDDLIKSDLKNTDINWKSMTTKRDLSDGIVGKKTFNSVKNYEDMIGAQASLDDCYEVPVYIKITKVEMDQICQYNISIRKNKHRTYDVELVLKIIQKYNKSLSEKIKNSEKISYQTPVKNYQRLITDNIYKADNNIKCNFFKRKMAKHFFKKDCHNLFFDIHNNRIVVEFFCGSKLVQ